MEAIIALFGLAAVDLVVLPQYAHHDAAVALGFVTARLLIVACGRRERERSQ